MLAHVNAWMWLLNRKVWPGQSIFWGCFGLDCIHCQGMRCCNHGLVSKVMKPFHSGAACQYFPLIGQASWHWCSHQRCKYKGDGGSASNLILLYFSYMSRTFSLGTECSPASWVECSQIHLGCRTVPCIVQNPHSKMLLDTGAATAITLERKGLGTASGFGSISSPASVVQEPQTSHW